MKTETQKNKTVKTILTVYLVTKKLKRMDQISHHYHKMDTEIMHTERQHTKITHHITQSCDFTFY